MAWGGQGDEKKEYFSSFEFILVFLLPLLKANVTFWCIKPVILHMEGGIWDSAGK